MANEDRRGTEVGRTLQMLRELMLGTALEAGSAAQLTGMKPNSVLRNLRQLEATIPGVEADRTAKPHRFRFNRHALEGGSPEEESVSLAGAVAVALGAAFAKVFTGSLYGTEFIKVRDRFVQGLPEVRRRWFSAMARKFVVVGGREEMLEDKGEILEEVLGAVLQQKRLQITYEKFEGAREMLTVEPYSLAVYDSHLYVLAIDVHQRTKGVRTFRFARIRDADALEDGFSYPEPNEYDPNVLFRDSIGIWVGEPAPCRVRIRLDARWAIYARHHRWHESQRTRDLEDGSVELELQVRPCPELEQWILRFGEGAEVLAPEELRQKMAERLRAAAGRYAAEDAAKSA